MTAKIFYLNLLGLTSTASATLALLHRFVPPAQDHAYMSATTVGLFVLVCIGLYVTGKNAARSRNKYAFTNLILASVLGKMVMALAYLYLYQQIAHPQNNWFVGIFLFCYVLFTTFEVWFMSKLAQMEI
ncbi:MAG: hypothetical protein KGS48_01925 [Bacteroidetes bacterium]|nr:hypothetical protein [Bacteroidota bacterium]